MEGQVVKSTGGSSLVDILDRVLDKGVVIAGDIQIKLADVELLTIKIRLLIASVDKAKEMGIDWWETDSYLSSGLNDGNELKKTNSELEKRIKFLEKKSETKPISKKRK